MISLLLPSFRDSGSTEALAWRREVDLKSAAEESKAAKGSAAGLSAGEFEVSACFRRPP